VTLRRTRLIITLLTLLSGLVLLVLDLTPAPAQVFTPIEGGSFGDEEVGAPPAPANQNLAELPQLSPVQSAMAGAIDIVCPKLAGLSSRNALQEDLFRRCQEMRHNALQLKTGSDLGNSLALSLDQLAAVLSAVSPEEAATQGTGAIETGTNQARAIAARLHALRLGATGLSLGELRFHVDGKTIELAQLLRPGDSGGGASADRAALGRFGAFVNGTYSFGDKDSSSREQGFDFHTAGVVAGADYRFTDNLVAGVALSYSDTDADIDFGLGDVDTRSYGVSLYGTYYVGGLYVDLLGSFNWNTYDTTRRIFYTGGPEASGTATGLVVDRSARGDTDGQQYTINLGAGYDFRRGPWTLTPYGRLEYLNLDIDGYTERGAQGLDLTIRSQRVESLQSALGGRVAYAISTPVGVVVPQVHAEWRHEFQNDTRSITAKYTHDPFDTSFAIPTDRPDRDYAALGAGVSGVFRRGVAAFLSYETILGLRDVSHHSFTGGVRIEF
jgi:outer membrane autotransporter protein